VAVYNTIEGSGVPHPPTSRNTPSCQNILGGNFFWEEKTGGKRGNFREVTPKFRNMFWNKDKLIEEIFRRKCFDCIKIKEEHPVSFGTQ